MRALLILATLLLAAGQAQADVATCAALFRNAPDALGGHRLTARTVYERKSPGSGYHLRYARNDRQLASVFLYDRGRDTFSERMLATELSVTTSQVFRMRAAGRNVTDGDVFFDRTKPARRGLFGIGFIHIEYDGRRLQHDFITLGPVDGCLVKLVYSSPGNRYFATRRFDRVLADLLGYVGQKR
ncbi:hypothetical protein K1T73_00690 [Roseovarius sp. SCSIO 43702]|uniref:hypothetical protein n=1 Tax=Roseovarius sp. SCSIO 43702 TaxID=2823043 RepID=UPI001C7338B9|nr:hypothetical protein [Roseovarius sp. SCSIO 43702]QYX56971.1 hypothetical protein K1T73_00690 [Roseovarius sp. SCSIO 43702]